jgi:predicted AlkP superfamily pyrophosphatase or phosphodiesterase
MLKSALFFVLLFAVNFSFSQKKSAPKLVVGIVVDQMMVDYLYRYQARFSKGGFVKLMNKGTNCRNTQYNYVPTYTGPGHASIYTGSTPSESGIVGNSWFDRAAGASVNCVTDSNYFSVGTESNYGLRAPTYLKCMTITDQLKATYSTSKVISMSIKDRGAILPGGHMSNGSYWFDFLTGNMITSEFYMNDLPDYVKNFNALQYPKKSMGNTWNTLFPLESYTASGPDDSPYEQLLLGKSKATFPYDFSTIDVTKSNPMSLFTVTPWANTYLTDFAISSLKNENLGKGKTTDFLAISYSTPDIAGHAFGPYAVEMEDMYLRLDLEIERLMKAIRAQVGKDFVIFLTADHAVVPVPQWLMDNNCPGGYAFIEQNLTNLGESIKAQFGANFILVEENDQIYLDQDLMEFMSVDRNEVERFVANEVAKWEGVKYVYTSADMHRANGVDGLTEMIRNGYDPNRSGNVIFVLESGYLGKSVDTESARKGTSHGSAYNYDTHVPLLWYGKNIPKKEVFERIEIIDIVPTLSQILNLQNPSCTMGLPIIPVLTK